MNRKFTTREKALLLILAVLLLVCGYFVLVFQPVTDAIADATLRQAEAESAILIEETRAIQLRQMQEALDNLERSDHLSQVPDYDNTQNVVRLLNGALSAASSYNLVFTPVAFEGNIARRSIDMTFTSGSYEGAKAIVQTLYDVPYRCEITALSLSCADGNQAEDITRGPVSTRLSITFFEYAEEPPAEEEPAA